MRKENLPLNILYGILISSFLILYFILSYNNRLAADDFYFLKNLNDFGWWQSMVVSWHTWVTRWSSILWLNAIFFSWKGMGGFLIYHLVSLVALYFAINRLWQLASGYWPKQPTASNQKPEASGKWQAATLFLISFFFLNGNIGETFFWITSTSMYLWGFIALCFLIPEILREKPTVFSSLICIVSSAFIGGAAEAVSVPALFILTAILVWQIYQKKSIFLVRLSATILLTAVGVSFAGEGRTLRQAALPSESITGASLITLRSIAQMEIYFLKEKFIWAILFFISWMRFAGKISTEIRMKPDVILKILAGYIILCFIFLFPTCYLLGEAPPFRAWILVSFLNCCCLGLCGILVGLHLLQPEIVKVISASALIGLIMLIGKTVIEQKEITTDYAQSVDSRMESLSIRNPQDTTTVVLEKLPESGLLPSSEIAADPTDFRNQHLKKYLGIEGEIRVRE